MLNLRNRAKDFEEIFPIQQIEDNTIISGIGDITLGYKLMLPEIFTLSPSTANSIQESFLTTLKILEPGIVLHKQDFFYSSEYEADFNIYDGFTQRKNKLRWDNKPVLRHYCNIYLTFPTSIKSINSVYSKAQYVTKKPYKFLDETKEKAKNIGESFFNSLNSIPGVKAKRMNDDELGCALFDYFNQSYHQPSSTFEDKTLQPYHDADKLVIGNKYISVISLTEEGGNLSSLKKPKTAPGKMYGEGVDYNNSIEVMTSLVYPLGLGLPINHVLNTIIEITDNDKIKGELSKENTKLNALTSFKYGPAISRQETIKNFQNTVDNNGYQSSKTAVNVILFNEDKEQLKKSENFVETAFGNMNGSRCWIENESKLSTFVTSCPGNARLNPRKFINVIDQAVCYLHKETHYYSDEEGFIYLDRFGNPVVINMWNSPYIVNRNKVVFGPSGSGKSFYINGLVDQSLSNKNHVIIIDIGHSYKRSCELNGGKYFDSADRKSLSFNLFLCETDTNGNYLYKAVDDDGEEGAEDKINFIYSVISWIWRKGELIKTEEKALIKRIIISFYEYINKNKIFPNFIEFYKFLSIYKEENKANIALKYLDFDSLMLLFEPYVSGEYQYLLNATENIDITEDKFLVFDLEDINGNEDLFNVVSLIVIELVLTKIKKLKGVKKTFIIDEALDFLKSDFGEFIAYLYRTFRKKGGEVYLAAQNVSFLNSCSKEIRDSITINTDTKILLDHSKNKSTYKDLKELLSLTDNDIELLDSIKDGEGYREFFIKMGDHARIFRNQVSPEAVAVYTTKEEEVHEIERLFELSGNLPSAIGTFIENKKIKTK